MGTRSLKPRDLTPVETVYSLRLRTVRLRVQRDIMAGEEIELITLSGPADVYRIAKAIYDGLDEDQEHFVLLVCNIANQVIGFKVVASGGQGHVFVDAKLVFRHALLLGAYNIIALHNHPTGDLTPSSADLSLTRKLVLAGRMLDIELLDSIIYSRRGILSMREQHPQLFDAGSPPDES